MNLREILEKKINRLGIKNRVVASQVCDAYNRAIVEMFGKDALKYTEAISFKDGVLKVRVANSAWAQEVQGKSSEILKRMNEKGFKVKRLVYRDL